jgi:hypothetical protein
MTNEKTLDDALDEMDHWSEKVVNAIEGRSPAEVVDYFKRAQVRIEKMMEETSHVSEPSPPQVA